MSEQPANLAAALAAVQAKLPRIHKGETAKVAMKTGGTYSYSYANLADVSAVVLPMLGAVGLAWITMPTITEAGKFVLRYRLLHVSGESIEGEYPLPMGTFQEVGSAITYARRYLLCAVVGVAPDDDDDDGATASRPGARTIADEWATATSARPRPTEPTIDPKAITQLAATITYKGLDDGAAAYKAAGNLVDRTPSGAGLTVSALWYKRLTAAVATANSGDGLRSVWNYAKSTGMLDVPAPDNSTLRDRILAAQAALAAETKGPDTPAKTEADAIAMLNETGLVATAVDEP